VFGLCVIAGHVKSIFVGFEGATVVPTIGGVLLALTPLAAGVALLVWVGIATLTRIVPAASLTAASLVPIVAWIADAPGETVAFTAVLACLVWWTHRDDVRRLLGGREAPSGDDSRARAPVESEPSTGAGEG
jgi:glycerol-3-phosphate acyltransferase PlsY